MREEVDTAGMRVAAIAARQHGVVSTTQLRGAGLEKSAISRALHSGRLHRVHRGVYAVGHRGICREGRWMAAVLACGDGAVLSHGSAAALWGLLRPMKGPTDVSTPATSGRGKRVGIRIHRCPSLQPRLVTERFRIPVTTPARTIADLRGFVSPQLRRRAIRQAEIAGFALGPEVEADRSRSDFEAAFLTLCRRQAFPAPEVNVRIGRWIVDFVWLGERLVVETDSYRYHRGSIAFEDDHARDLDLRGRGFEVRRFTERQVFEEPDRVAADLAATFGAKSGKPPAGDVGGPERRASAPHRVRRSPPPRHSSS